eukprot:CAMPEP_0206320776 /NCGR_PEP_ID=MMETSP0106_2-20121207/18511_1 /ASSEMBLY_ACC=CAM_ASM_000206 /TAXON_ID=81532 /ORGANISM="Acanthoeca-like sp., Strain 10tr" /LENGTH=80 /DNA_ID=CAMNT_0053752781 /DNA_START=62 /DNA_END=300 /DNA_ORIENTATION=-
MVVIQLTGVYLTLGDAWNSGLWEGKDLKNKALPGLCCNGGAWCFGAHEHTSTSVPQRCLVGGSSDFDLLRSVTQDELTRP